jgi:hypothetical protein
LVAVVFGSAVTPAHTWASPAGGDGAARRAAAAERPAELGQALVALDDLRYEDAAALLERAWRRGDNDPGSLALVFRLQGEVAATLGDEAAAHAAFQRWWAIAPTARLPPGTSPKIVASFDAARAQVAGKKPLGAHAELGTGALLVVIEADPLAQVAGARAKWQAQDGVAGVVERAGNASFSLPLPALGRLTVHPVLVDRFGNELLGLPALVVAGPGDASTDDALGAGSIDERGGAPADPSTGAGGVVGPGDGARAGSGEPRPAWASPWLWGGLTVAAAGAGVTFAILADRSRDELDALNATSSEHPFADAEAAKRRLEQRTLGLNVSVIAASALAVVTGVVIWRSRRPSSGAGRKGALSIVPAVVRGGGGISVAVPF